MMDDLVDTMLSGRAAGWEERECSRCGGPARFPAGLVRGTAFEQLAPLCDDCEGDDAHDALRDAVEVMNDPDELIARSGIADHPEVRLTHVVDEWLKGNSPGLFLIGDLGVGKTYQACQLVREWCRSEKRPALYVTEIDLYERLKQWSVRHTTRQHFKTVPLLVLDDIGTDRATEFKAGELYDLVDYREQHATDRDGHVIRRTVFVSNYSPEVLRQLPTMDERVMIRISRLCGGGAKKMTKDWEGAS